MPYGARMVLLCCLLCLSFLATAQQLPLRYHSQADGLGNLAVNVLAQDSYGYLWAGTENGLYRNDGVQFRRFGFGNTPLAAYITALHADAAGRIWVGTQQGLHLLQGSMRPLLHEGKPLPIWNGSVLASTKDGRLLVVSDGRLFEVSTADGRQSWQVAEVFDETRRRAHPQLRQITSVYVAPDGELWMGCGKGLCRYGPDGLVTLGASNGIPESEWNFLARDGKGTLWARGHTHVIALPAAAANASRIVFVDRTPASADERHSVHIHSLAPDAEGRMLAGMSDGVARWNGRTWETFGPANGLQAGGGINAILADRDGELWLGSLGYGLARWFGYQDWENWTTRDGLPATGIWSVHRDRQGQLRVGTRTGLAEWRGDLGRFAVDPGTHAGATHQRNSIVEDAHGNLWSSTFSGFLIRHEAASGRPQVVAQLPTISRLFRDRSGRLWIATEKGLYLIEHPGRDTTPILVDAASRMATSIYDACEDGRGKIWFASDQGVLGFADGRWRTLSLPKVPKGVPFATIACSKEDATIWLANADADAGLWQIDTAAAAPGAIDATPTELRHRLVFALHRDRRGWLWVATDNGVAVWNGMRWRVFDQQSGLVWNDCNGVLYEDRDGSMWIGTSNGVSHVLRPERLFAGARLDLVVERVERDGVELPAGTRLTLPWRRSPLQIEVAAPSYRNQESLVFRYRMTGLEDAWSSVDSPSLHYPPLPPGRYRLQIMAENPVLQAASDMTEIDFDIQPLWWQSRLFHFFCVLAVLLAVLAAHRYRLHRVVVRQRALEQLILERTRELEDSREALRVLASRDSLTEALNRRALMEALEKGLAQSRRDGMPMTLMLVDMDHFKRINDAYGHPAGDAVLKEAVRRLARMVRPYDSIGRYGGEEFVIVLPGFDGRSGCERIEQLQQAIRTESIRLEDGKEIEATCSAGVAVVEGREAITANELIKRADAALYRAKAMGRNRVEYAPPHQPTAAPRPVDAMRGD